MIDYYCDRWKLRTPVKLTSTHTSEIYLVQQSGRKAVLKVLKEKGEKFEAHGASALRCFAGRGAVNLLESDSGAHLLEYLDGLLLKSVVESGNDDSATQIIGNLLKELHAYAGPFPTNLISMHRNFRSLFFKAQNETVDSFFCFAAELAEMLIASENDMRVLHGDIHHENIIESSDRGWLAIDPQCLVGERTYDLANVFYNPPGFFDLAVSPEVIASRCEILAATLVLEKRRILQYACAYGALSAAWSMEDGQDPRETLAIAEVIRKLI